MLTKCCVPYRDRSLQNITSYTCSSTQTSPDDQVVRLWDELKMVGLPDDIDVQALFDPTGSVLLQKSH